MQLTETEALSGKRCSSGRSSHVNHPGPSPSVQQKITPHILFCWSSISHFPSIFFQSRRFAFLDTHSAKRRCCWSPRPLEMLPIDSPSNSTLDGMFAPHFRKRSLAKIRKNSKKSFRSLSQSKQEKKSRLESDFSNLVKSPFPGFRLFSNLVKSFPAPS